MEQIIKFINKFDRISKNVDLVVALCLILVLTMMMIPLHPVVLDLALSFSITLSIIILLVSVYTNHSLDFSIFPSLLLMTTLFRLSLNVASTRLILSDGHNGVESAGKVISAFGNFVVGNNYAIGFIVFVILIVINFIVITKGSGRVAEVAARFTLDAMPGKQMSIDADLNAGLINDQEARKRRQEIENEANFFGAMDGASKFVRGDAIAGIVITIVNIVGGLFIGVIQKDLSFSEAAQIYTKLTIGDGLVSQIPALIVSTAAGLVVTRNSKAKNMGSELVGQLLSKPKVIFITAGIMGILAMVPGLPTFSFLLFALVLGLFGWGIQIYEKDRTERKRKEDLVAAGSGQAERIETLLPIDLVELEVGYGLISVVESGESGDLLERIVSIRKQFALELGIIVPSIHIRDNLQLEPGEYRILIKGNRVAGGVLRSDCLLAMDPGNISEKIQGIPTKEPAFGLEAIWIGKSQKEKAEVAGYTVVDLPTVMATHLTEIVRTHAHEFFGRQEASKLIDDFKKSYPKVVEEVVPDTVPFGTVVRILQNLLREQVSIRDLLTVFETLADEGHKTKDPEILTEAVRKSMARTISRKLSSDQARIPVISLDPRVEEMIANSLLQTDHGVQLVMDPSVANELINQIAKSIESHPEIAGQPVLLTSPTSRRHVKKITSRFIPQLSVVSHSEISPEFGVTSVDIVEVRSAG